MARCAEERVRLGPRLPRLAAAFSRSGFQGDDRPLAAGDPVPAIGVKIVGAAAGAEAGQVEVRRQ